MDDFDQVLAPTSVALGQMLGNRHGAVTASRAADPEDQVRLALHEVLRQQVVEQPVQALVERVEFAVAVDERDDARVGPRQRPKVLLVMRIWQKCIPDLFRLSFRRRDR
jgi:hypothetical protein